MTASEARSSNESAAARSISPCTKRASAVLSRSQVSVIGQLGLVLRSQERKGRKVTRPPGCVCIIVLKGYARQSLQPTCLDFTSTAHPMLEELSQAPVSNAGERAAVSSSRCSRTLSGFDGELLQRPGRGEVCPCASRRRSSSPSRAKASRPPRNHRREDDGSGNRR